MLPTLQLGPLALNFPGLLILTGIWLGLTLSEKLAPRCKVNSSLVFNLSGIAISAAIVGARLTYIMENWTAFQPNLLSIFSINPRLLDPWGGAAAGLAALLWYSQKVKIPLSKVLDIFTPALAVMLMAVNLANLASGNGFGLPSELPWAIDLLGARRHPSQVYESLAAMLILVIVLRTAPWFQTNGRDGAWFWFFLALSALSRLFLEAFRAEGQLLFAEVRLAQVIAWLILACSLWMLKNRIQYLQ